MVLKINNLTVITFILKSAIILCKNVNLAPSLFFNHRIGPLPVLGAQNQEELANFLRNVQNIIDLKSLTAIIVISAHRQEDIVTISSGERPGLVHDYHNFPLASYLQYNASGLPALAREIYAALKEVGIVAKMDDKKGWDHGVFIPMMLINPKADIPIVQVSLLKYQDTKRHFEIGKALYRFRKAGVAIFGSGMSYHNAHEFGNYFFDAYNGHNGIVNDVFDDFLTRVCTGKVRYRKDILKWTKVPTAFKCHPYGKAEHLMPLVVNIGAAGDSPGRKVFETIYLKKFKLSGFIWQ